MTAKPILFSTPMVRAILDGRKTMTRRVPDARIRNKYYEYLDDVHNLPGSVYSEREFYEQYPPYYAGEILWVRETWNYGYIEESDAEYSSECWFEQEKPGYRPEFSIAPRRYWYKADQADAAIMDEIRGVWRPSIHMPKDAARLFLGVTGVWMERLQDISPEDCDAEGAKEYRYSAITGELMPSKPTYFSIEWDELYAKRDGGAYAWDKNPWVWVISFDRTEKPQGWPEGRCGNGRQDTNSG